MAVASSMSVKPGPLVAVMDRAPPQLAPMTAFMEASSSSICMNTPPASNILEERYSGISVAGVMG